MIRSGLRLILIALLSAYCASLIILCTPFDREKKYFRRFSRLHARGTLALAGLRLTVEGAEKLDPDQSYVYVANHASLFDIPVVLAGIPDDVRIIYKKELHYVPIFGWGLKLGGAFIAINRKSGTEARRSLDAAIEKIGQGASVLLFAEGTRSVDGMLQPFKRGPFNLALRAGVPVVPVTINGTHQIMQKGTFRLRPGPISIVIGTPIAADGDAGRESEMILRTRVREAIEQTYRNPS
ncbi:MAG TPA: lysophospholipid acyltransferase family protein [Bacteroidota bacterium]|nr:lysophospholipid acyltransferase family protein [Bacteroidota bacterium]